MKKFFWLLGVLACVPTVLFSQDITGIWRGHFRDNAPASVFQGDDDRYKIEVQIAQNANLFQAVTYSYRNTLFYGKATATGTVNPKTRKVVLREVKLVEVRMAGGDVCIMTCFLQYNKLNDDEYLTGTYTSVNTRDSAAGCGKGTIFLHRVETSDFHKEPFLQRKEDQLAAAKPKIKSPGKDSAAYSGASPAANATAKKLPSKKPALASVKPAVKPPALASATPGGPVAGKVSTGKKPAVKVAPARSSSVTLSPEQRHNRGDSAMSTSRTSFPRLVPAVISTRSNEVIKTITVTNETISLAIYDDGAVDNDTVSVYLDNRLLIAHARISDAPVTLNVRIDPEGTHELIMVADNLGDFPPNTSLMVVRDGEKKYEIRIVSTEQKNAVVRFNYQKP